MAVAARARRAEPKNSARRALSSFHPASAILLTAILRGITLKTFTLNNITRV
jgi:hypothetical protein